MRWMRKGALIALLLAVIWLLSGCVDKMHLEGFFFGENWVLELGDGYEVQCIDGENQLARVEEDGRIMLLAQGVEAAGAADGWLMARGEKDASYWLIDTTGDVVYGPFAGADAFETACMSLGAPADSAWTSLQGWPEDAEFALPRIYDEATAWELSTLDYPARSGSRPRTASISTRTAASSATGTPSPACAFPRRTARRWNGRWRRRAAGRRSPSPASPLAA